MIRKLIAFLLLIISSPLYAQEATPAIGSAPPLILNALAALNSSLDTSLVLNDLMAYSWAEEIFADTSLGCPQPGQSYEPISTRGFVFIFVYNTITYDYRAASDGTSLFLCESTPLQAAPTQVGSPLRTVEEIDRNNSARLAELREIEVEGLSTTSWAGSRQFAAAADEGLLLYAFDAQPTTFDTGVLTALTAVELTIVVGNAEGEITVFSPAGESLALEATDDPIEALAISPDGRVIVAGTESGLSFYNAQSGSLLSSLESRNPITTLVFGTRDEDLLFASGDSAGIIRLYRVDFDISASLSIRYSEIDILTGHTERINDLAFSPDGSRLASASDDQSARLWNTSIGAEIANLSSGAGEAVRSVALNGDVLAAAEGDVVRLWDVAEIEEITIIGTLSGHTGTVVDVHFSPAGTLLLSAGADNTVRLWGIT
jgi:WD40 repeat protein